MTKITESDRFVAAQALYSKLAPLIKTKNPDNLRGHVDAGYRAEWERTGAKTFSLRFLGEKVGTYSISETKGTPDMVERRFEVADNTALDAWVRGEDSRMLWDAYMTSHRMEFARWYFEQTGELPDGCTMAECVVKGEPGGQYIGGKVSGKFDADRVLELARDNRLFDGGSFPLLGGGEDD